MGTVPGTEVSLVPILTKVLLTLLYCVALACWCHGRDGALSLTTLVNVLFHLLGMRLGEEEPVAWFCRGSDGPQLASD